MSAKHTRGKINDEPPSEPKWRDGHANIRPLSFRVMRDALPWQNGPLSEFAPTAQSRFERLKSKAPGSAGGYLLTLTSSSTASRSTTGTVAWLGGAGLEALKVWTSGDSSHRINSLAQPQRNFHRRYEFQLAGFNRALHESGLRGPLSNRLKAPLRSAP